MSNKSRISVVVPVYNRERLLERSLESIRSQEVRPLSIVIVDNNSTDRSMEVARRWAEVNRDDPQLYVQVVKETRRGAAAARQMGLTLVHTEWVCFFDSDDEMAPGILNSALAVAGDSDIVCWRRVIVGLDRKRRQPPFRPSDPFRAHVYNCMFSTQSYMVRSSFIRRVGGWNEKAMVWNDWELGLRLLLSGPGIKALDKVGAIVYSQENSITGKDFHSKQGEWESTISLCEDSVRAMSEPRLRRNGLPSKSVILEMLDYRRVNLAATYHREGKVELGEMLMKKTLENSAMSRRRERLLRLIYRYTRLGGRGAYLLWR